MRRPRDSLRPAVFLDRDGVLNETIIRNGRPHPPARVDEFVLLPGVADACALLRRSGFVLVVVTNQPDIARGHQDSNTVEAMHELVKASLEPDAIYMCPHDDSAKCACRKPQPGMLLTAKEELGLDLGGSFLVGDRWRDIEAGKRAGCRTIFVNRNYTEKVPLGPDLVVSDFPSAVPWIQALRSGAKETRSA
jgi:D-glycero-D-manno-heptose 1,7-bisphosphate phosphatase